MSSFVVIHVGASTENIKVYLVEKKHRPCSSCYLEGYYKCPYIYFNSRPPPFENPGYEPGNDGAID